VPVCAPHHGSMNSAWWGQACLTGRWHHWCCAFLAARLSSAAVPWYWPADPQFASLPAPAPSTLPEMWRKQDDARACIAIKPGTLLPPRPSPCTIWAQDAWALQATSVGLEAARTACLAPLLVTSEQEPWLPCVGLWKPQTLLALPPFPPMSAIWAWDPSPWCMLPATWSA